MVLHSVCLMVELSGPHAYVFARQHHAGSRVVLRGHLAERTVTRTEQLPRADGPGTVAVLVARYEYVVVVERVLHSDVSDVASQPQDTAPQRPAPEKAPPQGASTLQWPGVAAREWSF
jgi:hypothetical protein